MIKKINKTKKIVSSLRKQGKVTSLDTNKVLAMGTKKTHSGYCAWFSIGVQGFFLQEVDTLKEAKWFVEMLVKAFEGFRQPTLSPKYNAPSEINPYNLESVAKHRKKT